jgi:integrase
MPAPYAIFCVNPLDPRSMEPDFSSEFAGAREAGFSPILIDHDELDQRISPAAALRKTRIDEPGIGIYRGWMLRSEAYAGLFNALFERGVRLLTSPEEYAACHHAPGAYSLLKNWMASMTWVPLPDIDDQAEVRASLAKFGSSAVILKDYVKSQAAGYWSQKPNPHALEHARLVSRWVASIGLDAKLFGTHSLRRTKATLIYRRTGNLRAVQLLLGHTKIESTVRYLGIEVDDALAIAE